MAEAQDVPELVECDVLDVVAAVGDRRLELAPLEAAPVELPAVGSEGDAEVSGACQPSAQARPLTPQKTFAPYSTVDDAADGIDDRGRPRGHG